jgi:hypothetical protein
MAWTVINSGPYIEQLGGSKKPIKMADGTYLFAFPLPEGAVPYIYLDDFAAYIDWIFQNPTESNGMTLDVAVTFTAVTGKPPSFKPSQSRCGMLKPGRGAKGQGHQDWVQ